MLLNILQVNNFVFDSLVHVQISKVSLWEQPQIVNRLGHLHYWSSNFSHRKGHLQIIVRARISRGYQTLTYHGIRRWNLIARLLSSLIIMVKLLVLLGANFVQHVVFEIDCVLLLLVVFISIFTITCSLQWWLIQIWEIVPPFLRW